MIYKDSFDSGSDPVTSSFMTEAQRRLYRVMTLFGGIVTTHREESMEKIWSQPSPQICYHLKGREAQGERVIGNSVEDAAIEISYLL